MNYLIPNKSEIASKLRKPVEEVKIGFYSSILDLCHAGHIAALREAKENCDFLICAIVNDPTIDRPYTKNKPVQSLFERYIAAASNSYVDCVIPLSGEQDLKDALLLLLPDIRFVGLEYKGSEYTGSDIDGIEVHYLQRRHSFSTSDLRKRVLDAGGIKEATGCPKLV